MCRWGENSEHVLPNSTNGYYPVDVLVPSPSAAWKSEVSSSYLFNRMISWRRPTQSGFCGGMQKSKPVRKIQSVQQQKNLGTKNNVSFAII